LFTCCDMVFTEEDKVAITNIMLSFT